MTLHIYDVEQRSDEWYALRRGILTASTVGQLVTPTLKVASNDKSRALVWQLVAERINGRVEETYQSRDMWRGVIDEPVARAIYSEHYAPVAECGFMVREQDGWRLGYSPDGLVGDDGLVEIKSHAPKRHVEIILSGQVPGEHMAQIQAGLLVSGRAWCDYLSYRDGMPMWRHRVEPDERWHEAITQAVTQFEETAAQHIADYERAVLGLVRTEKQAYDFDAELTL